MSDELDTPKINGHGGARPGAGRKVKKFRPVPPDMQAAIDESDDFEKLGDLSKRVMSDLAAGRIERPLALALCEIIRERRQILKLAAKGPDSSDPILLATPAELEALKAMQAATAPPAVGPEGSAAIVRPTT